MSTLSLQILTILDSKKPGELVYLRGREELQGYGKRVILAQAEKLAEAGYLKLVHEGSFVKMDNHLVNYFFEITPMGKDYLRQLQLKTG